MNNTIYMATYLPSCEFNTKAFERIKKILKRYEQGMKVLVEDPGVYYLAYNTPADNQKDHPSLFAALVARKSGLYLYLPALKAFPGFKSYVPVALLEYISNDGLRFQSGANISNIMPEVEMIIKLSVGII